VVADYGGRPKDGDLDELMVRHHRKGAEENQAGRRSGDSRMAGGRRRCGQTRDPPRPKSEEARDPRGSRARFDGSGKICGSRYKIKEQRQGRRSLQMSIPRSDGGGGGAAEKTVSAGRRDRSRWAQGRGGSNAADVKKRRRSSKKGRAKKINLLAGSKTPGRRKLAVCPRVSVAE